MYHVYLNQAASSYSSHYFFIFLSLQFSTLKYFVTLFSGTVRPRRLKLGTHVDSGQMYHVYWNQAAAAYLSLYFFIFLSLQFSTLKFFITLFSGTMRPWRMKISTHVDSGQIYQVYQNQAAAAYSSLYFFIFLSFQFSSLKFFIALVSETVRPRRLKLGTHIDSGQIYHVYWNQAAASYSSRSFFIFFSLQFSNIKKFLSHFSQELIGLEDWNLVQMWIVGWCIVYTGIRLLLLIHHIISSFSFLSSFQHWKIFITFFSGTVRSRRLKLGTHVVSGQMYRVYRNQAAAYLSLYSFFFLSNFQTKFFVTLFSGTNRPGRLKLGTNVDSGLMYRLYWNQASAVYSSHYFFIFLSLQFSTLKNFHHIFLRNCEV